MHSYSDTIVAIASAVGPAPRMIVRMSGPSVSQIAADISSQPLPDGACAARVSLSFAGLQFPAILYRFVAPRSYTGEDSIEFHIPGNPLLTRMLVDELVRRGARPAEPGEFTARAYFNGRLDLTEAEGVAAVVSASSERELRAARQLLAGELARRLRPVTDAIVDTLALVETGIDFSDEAISVISASDLAARVDDVDGKLASLLADSTRFERLSHEPRIVLAGRPNAGKSTLLNALAGRQRAVTSPVAGTTRDVLSAEIALRRGIVQLIDAAGIESNPASNQPIIERQMVQNALRAIESADVLVLVRDSTDASPLLPLARVPDIVLLTKSDLPNVVHVGGELHVSAKTGENIDILRDRLDVLAFGDASATAGTSAASLSLNARHVQAVSEARDALHRAGFTGAPAEIVALELREALDALGRVVGMVSPDDVLGRIFSTFCIGK